MLIALHNSSLLVIYLRYLLMTGDVAVKQLRALRCLSSILIREAQ
jgi:hypothetical protein